MVTILKDIVDEYEVSDEKTRVALVDYNGPATTRALFSDGYNRAIFKRIASSLPGPGGRPGTLSEAFSKVRDEVFTLQNGARPFAEDILVVMTQGNFDENSAEIKSEVAKLRSNAVKVIVFAFTDEPGIEKWNNVSSGNDLIVITKPGKDKKEAKKLPYTASKGASIYAYKNALKLSLLQTRLLFAYVWFLIER